jgi:hypothetical protein
MLQTFFFNSGFETDYIKSLSDPIPPDFCFCVPESQNAPNHHHHHHHLLLLLQILVLGMTTKNLSPTQFLQTSVCVFLNHKMLQIFFFFFPIPLVEIRLGFCGFLMMGFWVGNARPLCFHLFSFVLSILGFVLVVIFWGKRGHKLESHQVQILLLIFGDPFLRAWVPIVCPNLGNFVGLAYQGKDIIVFRFIIEYSSLRDFVP